MSNGSPPITSAPVPPSVPGVPQPVIVTGGQSLPPSFPLGQAGTWMPPPQVGMGENTPFPTPVVPPGSGNPGVTQPQYGSGSGTVPTAASLFPAFTTTSPSPPIVFANTAMIGAGFPPQTATTTQVPISTAPNIPQLPWVRPGSTSDGGDDGDDGEERRAMTPKPPPKPDEPPGPDEPGPDEEAVARPVTRRKAAKRRK
jgi:hypothetical protein